MPSNRSNPSESQTEKGHAAYMHERGPIGPRQTTFVNARIHTHTHVCGVFSKAKRNCLCLGFYARIGTSPRVQAGEGDFSKCEFLCGLFQSYCAEAAEFMGPSLIVMHAGISVWSHCMK